MKLASSIPIEWHYGWIIAAGVLSVVSIGPLRAELNPWAGSYSVTRVEPGAGVWTAADTKGSEFNPQIWGRHYVEVSADGRIDTGAYWPCGVKNGSVDGTLKWVGSKIHIMERSYIHQPVSTTPLLVLETRGRDIIRETPVEGGRTVLLTFSRVENAPTILDYIGFR